MKRNGGTGTVAHGRAKHAVPPAGEVQAGKKQKNKGKRVRKAILWSLLALCVLAVGYFVFCVRPPEVVRQRLSFLYPQASPSPEVTAEPTPTLTPTPTPTPEPTPTPTATAPLNVTPMPAFTPVSGEEYCYTFAIFGVDTQDGYADTVIVCRFDMNRRRLDAVSLPPDTLVNASTDPRRLNALYASGGTAALLDAVSRITGFTVDFSVTVQMTAFSALVDAIGGVEYTVPMDMHYEDASQNLVIDLAAGAQVLDGDKALQLVRFRSGYSTMNTGRIETQNAFLMAAASQIMQNKASISMAELARIFVRYCDTDLTYGNVIWFAREFLAMDNVVLNLQTLPGSYAENLPGVGGDALEGSWYCIDVDAWLMNLNAYLSPYAEPFTAEELSILRYDAASGAVTATNGMLAVPAKAAEEDEYDEDDGAEASPTVTDGYTAMTPAPKPVPEAQLPEKP